MHGAAPPGGKLAAKWRPQVDTRWLWFETRIVMKILHFYENLTEKTYKKSAEALIFNLFLL